MTYTRIRLLPLVLALVTLGPTLQPAGAASFVPTSTLPVTHYWHSATLLPNGKVLVAGGVSRSRGEVFDPVAGTWVYDGSLATARHAHTATLLPNGTVLIAGGMNNTIGPLSSAELYDPAARKFTEKYTETGALSHARWLHTATLLPDGKVLVVGGSFSDGSDHSLSSAELYDPATGNWKITGALSDARELHTATLLPDGKVLVVGGYYYKDGDRFLSSSEVYDPATGKWTTTGALSEARDEHTATLLPDGTVLVAGGYYYDGSDHFLSSAELYDPTTGNWTATGALSDARDLHTATLLRNGKVLVAGGYYYDGSNHYLSSAEVYDWDNRGTWTETGALNDARDHHTATLLPNGKVLVAGGQNESSDTLSNAEVYDLAKGTWTATGSLGTGRFGHTATLLPNGKVLVAGGVNSVSGDLSSAELYDPATGMWAATSALGTERSGHTATLLPNGKVLVAGGQNDSSDTLSSAELYGPATGMWTETGALGTGRSGHTATLLPNGKVLVAGGVNNLSGDLSSAELYDPATGTWTETGALGTGRSSHTATLLPNENVLVAGGANTLSGALSSVELYDPATGTWTETGALSNARQQHTATRLPNGTVLVAGGGHDTSGALFSVELFDPVAGMWVKTGALSDGRQRHTATLLPDGKVLVAGGVNDTIVLSKAELYDPAGDPASGTWTETGTMSDARFGHTATLLPNGKVLVAGGGQTYDQVPLSSAELYDPSSGTWLATGALHTARLNHTATLLLNGKVLIAGGYDPVRSVILSSAELYDPATGLWTATAPTHTPRISHTMTLLPNGKVLIAGGQGSYGGASSYLSSAELYDPATGIWTFTGAMHTAHYQHTATLLPDGKVLVASGDDSSGNFTTSAELYDPATGTWTQTGALNHGRRLPTATLLPNGKVLVVGGFVGELNADFSAELYDPANRTWTETSALGAARPGGHTATLLPNGKVLVAGAYGSSAELYDPASGTWTFTGAMNTERRYYTATLLPNGKVLVTGGNIGNTLASAELYDAGLGFSAIGQPEMTAVSSPLSPGGSLTLAGSGFRGLSGASGGNTQDSASDHPVVQLRSLENGQSLFLHSTSWSPSSYTSAAVSGLPPGWTMVTMFVNGIPSVASILFMDTTPLPGTILLSQATKLPNGGFQFTLTNTPGISFSVVATTDPSVPLGSWTALGSVTEVSPGQFQFTDLQATNYPRRFYRVRSQ